MPLHHQGTWNSDLGMDACCSLEALLPKVMLKVTHTWGKDTQKVFLDTVA